MASFYGNCHIENIVAGEAITAPAWVYVSTSDGKMYKASAVSTTNPAVGLVFADVASGDTGQAVFSGVIEWDFLTPISAARVYYLSSSSAGAQTTTAPTNKQHLGYATSSTRLIINPQPFAEAGGGGGGGVASVTGPGVDNTDAANPEVNARPYNVYTALWSQTGTDAPTVTVIENTFSAAISWTYSDVGTYVGELTGAFVVDKTVTNLNTYTFTLNNADTGVYLGCRRTNSDTVTMRCFDATISPVEAEVYEMFLEIRVY